MAIEQKYLKIDGVDMPVPSKYTYVDADLDSEKSSRSETGVANRDRLRAGVRTIKCGWKAISTVELHKILNAIRPVWVQVSAASPMILTGDHMATFTAYAQGTREATIVRQNANFLETLWSFECSFIEQ